MKKTLLGAIAVLAMAGSGVLLAQVPQIPKVLSIGPNDLFQDIVGGIPQAGNSYASAALMGNFGQTQSGNNPENALIGGDATTNLWQRATTGSSVTTTVTYGGPDRWAYWSGTSTAMTVSRDSTAADLSTGYQYAFKMARTSGQTGVVQMCMMQEVESANSYRFAGQTAELDFHAATGANFSAASGNMTAYIITGTGADEGVAGSASGAFGLNAGGGGSGGWTTQVNWAGVVPLGGASTNGRYTIAAPIPVGTTEIAVALCYKPVGTAGTNDYVAFSGIQLLPNSALTSVAGANASGTASVLSVNDTRAKAFLRRPQGMEAALQQRYYYQITETATITPRAVCHVTTANSVMQCGIQFPVTMRIAPAQTYAAGFAGFTTTAETTATNCSALAIDATVVFLNSPIYALAQCTLTSSTIAVGLSMTLVDNSGTGAMKYNAEL